MRKLQPKIKNGLADWLRSNQERTQLEPVPSSIGYEAVDWAETTMECITLEGNAGRRAFHVRVNACEALLDGAGNAAFYLELITGLAVL